MYNDAPFVILDEPTASLDPIAEYEIYSRFNGMVKDKTAVYLFHRLSSCSFCDKIAVLHEGEMIQFGSHEEFLKKYRRQVLRVVERLGAVLYEQCRSVENTV